MNRATQDKNPLRDKRIAVTRARHQAPLLEKLIRESGGIPASYPCIAIMPPQDLRPLDAHLSGLGQFDWLLLTSSNTVRALADRYPELRLQLADAPVNVAAVGAATAAELRRILSRDADFVPGESGAGQLARHLPVNEPARILLPQSDRADKSTAEMLRARGAEVTTAIAYRTVIGEGGEDLPAMISRREIAALSFTSTSAVTFFRQRCPLPAALNLPAFCIGSAAAEAANDSGFNSVITAPEPSLNSMLQALADHFTSSSKPTLR